MFFEITEGGKENAAEDEEAENVEATATEDTEEA